MIKNFLIEEEGVTLVEYGLLVGLISVVAITAITSVGSNVNALFETVASALSEVVNNA
ncbi:MAG: Flp family type IVb pilin [Alphaproteobacteria bacterium]